MVLQNVPLQNLIRSSDHGVGRYATKSYLPSEQVELAGLGGGGIEAES